MNVLTAYLKKNEQKASLDSKGLSVSVRDKINVTQITGSRDHDQLNNLDYEHSGHTGFASEVRLNAVEQATVSNADDIAAIKAGTVKAGDASKLNGQSASYYLNYNNLTNKPDIPTVPEIEIVGSGSGSFVGNVTADGYTLTLSKKNISVSDLPNSGVTAGTYSVVTVDATGRATAGGTILEVGSDGQSAPSAILAIGGIFFQENLKKKE